MSILVKGIVIGIIIGLVIGGVAGYLIKDYSSNKNFRLGRGQFQLDDKAVTEIANFFDGNPDANTTNSYCQQNRMNCAYYCKNINPNNEICSQFNNMSRRNNGPIPN